MIAYFRPRGAPAGVLRAAAACAVLWLAVTAHGRAQSAAPAASGQASASILPQQAAPVPVRGDHSTPRDPLLAEKYAMRDTERDTAWASEAVNEEVGPRLSELAKRIAAAVKHGRVGPEVGGETARSQLLGADLNELVAEQITCSVLRPADLQMEFESSAATVWRSKMPLAPESPKGVGTDAFLGEVANLLHPFQPGSELHVKFKTIDVQLGGADDPEAGGQMQTSAAMTRAFVMIDGLGPLGLLQQNATWRCRWRRESDGAKLRLESIILEAYEECRGAKNHATLFADHTQSALGNLDVTGAWSKQLTRSLEHWAGEIDASLGGAIVGHEGIALGDIDADGRDDLYVCQSGGLPNRMFRQREDGTLEDVSAAWGVDFLDSSHSALILDFDNDGDQDLAVAIDPIIVLLENRGQPNDEKRPRFEIAARLLGPSVTSLAAADIDSDGDLDLYACGYTMPDRLETTPVPYHDANNGQPNLLYRNQGAFGFVDATRECGLDHNNRRFSFAASFEDYDNDGDQDLYVANDFGRNNLYRNEGGVFRDVAAEAGVEDVAASMGVTWADFDGDGLLDLYVSNMFSSAGERVTFQRSFRPDLDDATRALFQRHARGNSLFRNQGNGTFSDVSVESGTTMGRWAWGAKFVDFDNDGRPDIFVPNGFVTGEDPGDL